MTDEKREAMGEERRSTLRQRQRWYATGCPGVSFEYLQNHLPRDAADDLLEALREIDRLRAENERLKDAMTISAPRWRALVALPRALRAVTGPDEKRDDCRELVERAFADAIILGTRSL